jgi:hypothetical protein
MFFLINDQPIYERGLLIFYADFSNKGRLSTQSSTKQVLDHRS